MGGIQTAFRATGHRLLFCPVIWPGHLNVFPRRPPFRVPECPGTVPARTLLLPELCKTPGANVQQVIRRKVALTFIWAGCPLQTGVCRRSARREGCLNPGCALFSGSGRCKRYAASVQHLISALSCWRTASSVQSSGPHRSRSMSAGRGRRNRAASYRKAS